MPPGTPATPPAPVPEKKRPKGAAWDRLRDKANAIGSIVALFVFLVAAGGVGGYFYSQSKKAPKAPAAPTIQTLTPAELSKLNEIGANLGTANQTLNIAANALFRGKADITGDLTIGGRLNANGPVTLSQLNIVGDTAATGLNVGSNLLVGGTTTLQKTLTVNQLVTINSNLNVTGTASVGALNASSIAVRTISISGPLTIGHLISSGTVPFISAGSVGAGGTVSISGNDTAGTVNINTGTGPSGMLAAVTFHAPFAGTAHVQLTPLTSGAAGSGYFASRTSTGFQVHATTPPSGQTLSFDYLITQ
jgi:hypothetical protein